ncbi:MAG: colanic acid biosynthesis glycosyltransferase WcaL [Proteobacteria bacterium]|nr:colanic acid biosynthesis glycosyltransferase WcaL [Pseudomonadota bacterium]
MSLTSLLAGVLYDVDRREPPLTNPMRVAHFTSEFLPSSQTFIYRELTEHVEYEMDAFAHTRLNHDRFPFERVHAIRPSSSALSYFALGLYLATGASATFIRRFQATDYTLVHAQFGPAAVYASLYADLFDLPLICTFGGRDVGVLCAPAYRNPDYLYYRLNVKRLFNRIDRFLPVSEHLAQRLISLGAPPERVQVFYRGVATPTTLPNRDQSKKQAPVVLLVGRFVEKKGFEYGIEAFAKLIANGVIAQLKFIGDGERRAKYENIIQQAGAEGLVSFLGDIPQADVFKEMTKADVLIVPSVTGANGDVEGVANVLKEGNAHGLPAIVTRHGGLPEVVEDGVTGFIVEERDSATLAAKLMLLISNPELRLQMGTAAWRKMHTEFDFQRRAGILEQHYDEVFSSYRSVEAR